MLFSCSKEKAAKPPTPTPISNSMYGDSIFYVEESVSNYIITPVSATSGSYSCIPEGLKIDSASGAIDVNKSETGLKYKIIFTPAGAGTVQTSYIIISGINYADKIYNLSSGDSVATPIYNANNNLTLPGIANGTSFDENGGCKKAGIEVDPQSAVINLAKSVRDQKIDTGATQEVKLAYRINDGSHQSLNGLNVKIYFYRTASEIPQYLTDLLNERKGTILTAKERLLPLLQTTSLKSVARLAVSSKRPARPRPPCIIVVSR